MIILHFKMHMLGFNRSVLLCSKQKELVKPLMVVAHHFRISPSTDSDKGIKESKSGNHSGSLRKVELKIRLFELCF